MSLVKFLRKTAKYALVFFAGWIASFISALIASKGLNKMSIVVDSEEGIVDDVRE